MVDFLKTTKSVAYKSGPKRRFHELATEFLERIRDRLNLKVSDIRSNMAGIAVSGEVILHGMRTDNVGIYIMFSVGSMENAVMVRTVTSMKDYTGGPNMWVKPSDQMEEEIVGLANRLIGRLTGEPAVH